MHFDLAAIPQSDKLLVDPERSYARTGDLFAMERIGLAERQAGEKDKQR